MQNNPDHNASGRIRWRLLCCEAMVSAVCLVVLSRRVWGFLMIGEKLSFTQWYDMSVYWTSTFDFLVYYAKGVMTAVVSLTAVLVVSIVNASLFGNNQARNLVRVCLIAMFLAIIFDLILLTGHAYVFWSYFFS